MRSSGQAEQGAHQIVRSPCTPIPFPQSQFFPGSSGVKGAALARFLTAFDRAKAARKHARAAPVTHFIAGSRQNDCTRCAKNCLRFPVAAFDLVCAYVRSAAAAAGVRTIILRRRSKPSGFPRAFLLNRFRFSASYHLRSSGRAEREARQIVQKKNQTHGC